MQENKSGCFSEHSVQACLFYISSRWCSAWQTAMVFVFFMRINEKWTVSEKKSLCSDHEKAADIGINITLVLL